MQQWYGGAGQRQPNPHDEWYPVRTIESEPVAISAATAAKQTSSSTSPGWALESRPSRLVPVLPPGCNHALLLKQASGMEYYRRPAQAGSLFDHRGICICRLRDRRRVHGESVGCNVVGRRARCWCHVVKDGNVMLDLGSYRKRQGSNRVSSRRNANGTIPPTGQAPVLGGVLFAQQLAQQPESGPAQKRRLDIASLGEETEWTKAQWR